MKTYPTKKLGEVCEISAGGSAPQGERFFDNGKYPFFRTSDVGAVHLSDNLCDVRDYLNDEGIKKLNLFKKGTILFPKSGASTFLNHRVVMGCDGYVSSHLATISTGGEIDYKYLYHFLTLVDAKDIAPNSSYPSLRIADIAKIEIPLPPLAEQKKIVAKLERVLAKIKEAKKLREEAKSAAAALLPAELHKIFEEGKKNGWMEKRFEEVLDYEQPGQYIVNSKNYSSEYKTPVLTAGKTFVLGNTNEKDNIFPAEKLPVIIFDDFTTATKFVDFPFKVKSSAMKILHTNKQKADAKFLFYIMQTIDLNHITHKRYWISEYSKIKIPLPPIAEQKKIVERLDSLSGKIASLRQAQAETQNDFVILEQSILQKAFS